MKFKATIHKEEEYEANSKDYLRPDGTQMTLREMLEIDKEIFHEELPEGDWEVIVEVILL